MPQAPQTVMPQGVVTHSFGTFSWVIVLAIVVVVFCVMYLWVRRKGHPKQIDEKLSMELRVLSTNAGLKGASAGEEQCENCVYYLENTADLSYCWHPKLRILVGAKWGEQIPSE